MKKMKLQKYTVDVLFSTLAALALGFLAGALLLLFAGYDPMSAYGVMFDKLGANFGQVIGKATPLIFTGLAVAIPYSVGFVNIGAEGQVIAGALLAALAGQLPGLPAVLHIPLVFLAGAVGGLLFSTLCGWLKLRFAANEVVTCVMLNTILLLLGEYLCNGPLNGVKSQPQTAIIQPSAVLGKLRPTDNWSIGIFFAVGAAVCVWVFMRKTVLGYEVRAAGLNPVASAYKGINIKTTALLAVALGGAMAGMAGAVEVMGVRYSYYQGFVANYGFSGMGVALIAWNHPLAIIPSALFLSSIRVGGMALDRLTMIPSNFIWVLQGTMIIAMAIRGLNTRVKNGATALFGGVAAVFKKPRQQRGQAGMEGGK